MSETEWYVIDTRTNKIINCITTQEQDPIKLLQSFQKHYANPDVDSLRLDNNPPQWMLEQYEYWNERP